MYKNKQSNISSVQIMVPSPLWLQRRMRKNLQTASKNKVDRNRASKARKILLVLQMQKEETCLHPKAPPASQQTDFKNRQLTKQHANFICGSKAMKSCRNIKRKHNRPSNIVGR